MKFNGYDSDGNYIVGFDWLAWLFAAVILAEGIAILMILR